MSKIYLEIFDQQRKDTFDMLRAFQNNCYLAGGTALALQIGHRRSVDFDLFTPKPVNTILKKKVRDTFGDVRFYINSADQISFNATRDISITLLYYWFPLLGKLIHTDSVPLAPVADILADKAHTLGRRAVWRDYGDIYYVLKENILSIEALITNAKKKFGGEFVTEQFLEQLVYYDDVEIVQINWLGKEYSTKEIQDFLKKTVYNYMESIKK